MKTELELFYYFKKTNIGYLTIACNHKEIIMIGFGKIIMKNYHFYLNKLINQTFNQIEEYLCGKRKKFEISLSYNATNLEKKNYKNYKKYTIWISLYLSRSSN